MITIEERKPNKLPGISTLFVSFNYNAEIVNQLKNSTTVHNYDAKTHEWEVPISDLSKLLDNLCSIDKIQLNVLKDKAEKKDKVFELSEHKTKPYPYQEDGIQYGLNHKDFLLLDQPGLGKTLQTIILSEELKQREDIQHCLIICGINTLKSNWVKEIERHSNLDCMILGQRKRKNGKIINGGIKERLEDLKNPIKEFYIITNIETLRSPDILKALNDEKINKFDIILVDEVHKFKNPTSEQGKNFLKLKQGKHRVAMTGTLLLNNPVDAYVALKFIGIDNSTFTNFKYYYCNFGGPFNNILLGYRNIKYLKDQLAKYSIRRTKDILNLPERNIIDEYIDMEDDQKALYDNIVHGVVDQIDKVELNTSNLLAMMARLRQAADCPTLLTTEKISNTKAERTIDLVEEIVGNGDKVVIFDVFKQPLIELADKLKSYNPLLCTGDIDDRIISENVDKFQNNDENKVMLCTTAKMGTGLTLTAASYAIFLNTPYTYADFDQCMSRVHRIGSKKTVFIYNLICRDTVDERVKEIVSNKEMISDYVIDNKCSPNMKNKLKDIIMDLKRI